MNEQDVADVLRELYEQGFIELETTDDDQVRVWPTEKGQAAAAERQELHGQWVIEAGDASLS